MKRQSIVVVLTLVGAIALPLTACQRSATSHKLVGADGKHSVPLYADEATYKKVSQQPAAADAKTQQVDDQTPVVIISTDDDGAVVQIIDGPLKGQNGFVTKNNVD
jgi:transcription antitermination factor NusG